MPKHPRGKICDLLPHEAEEFEQHGIAPRCADHRHLSADDAHELTSHFAFKRTASGVFADGIVARWVGPHHITRVRAYGWRTVGQTRRGGTRPGFPVRQLTPSIAAPAVIARARSLAGGRSGPVRRIFPPPPSDCTRFSVSA